MNRVITIIFVCLSAMQIWGTNLDTQGSFFAYERQQQNNFYGCEFTSEANGTSFLSIEKALVEKEAFVLTENLVMTKIKPNHLLNNTIVMCDSVEQQGRKLNMYGYPMSRDSNIKEGLTFSLLAAINDPLSEDGTYSISIQAVSIENNNYWDLLSESVNLKRVSNGKHFSILNYSLSNASIPDEADRLLVMLKDKKGNLIGWSQCTLL